MEYIDIGFICQPPFINQELNSVMNLPVDLIIEILYFLPVKSLFRFECVCKTWESLIKNQIFIRKQSQKEGSKSSLLLRNHDSFKHKLVISLFKYDYNGDLIPHCNLQLDLPRCCAHSFEQYGDDDVHVIGPCNGLVCVSIYCGLDMEIILWNPSMRESRILPPSSIVGSLDPSFNPTFGFGFDSDSNDHKVVKFRQSMKDKSIFYVEIYSTASNSWIQYQYADYLWVLHDGGDECIIDTSRWVAVVFKETCCWLAKGLVGGEIILSFDMSTYDFRKTLLPLDAFQSAQQTSQILHFRNSLALIVGRNSLEESTFHIWTIDDLNAEGSWTKMTTIGPILGNYGSLAFWRNYDFLILEDFKSMELISCDLRSHKTKKMGVNKTRFRFDTVFNYIETSVSVDIPNPYASKGLAFSRLISQLQRYHLARFGSFH